MQLNVCYSQKNLLHPTVNESHYDVVWLLERNFSVHAKNLSNTVINVLSIQHGILRISENHANPLNILLNIIVMGVIIKHTKK